MNLHHVKLLISSCSNACNQALIHGDYKQSRVQSVLRSTHVRVRFSHECNMQHVLKFVCGGVCTDHLQGDDRVAP